MGTVNIYETFQGIQGESTWAGTLCFFIRLAGCNLRCNYCDTTYAYKPGKDVEISELVREAAASTAAIIEITGGEPLIQAGFRELAIELRDKTGKPVLVETNGSCDISLVPEGVITIMDIKCPGSGQNEAMDLANLKRLRRRDEVKFVLSDRNDYDWAKQFVQSHSLVSVCNVLFSPVFGILQADNLGRWIIRDGLPVRLQMQLHKIIGAK
jgi:7-carboxy-7-deazaguanine synthase